MYEVIVTCRPDFREFLLARFPTYEEAQAKAEEVMKNHHERFLRTWVRTTQEARTKPEK